MRITVEFFSKVAGQNANSNMASALRGLEYMGERVELQRPHRLAMFMAQTGHESMGWHYDREIWGPTKAQKRYEGRKDLGNTQPGDGNLFRGYTPMQITGRHNTTLFYNWCVKEGLNPPDFTKQPHLMNTDPWEGIGPLWYWHKGKPESLNVSADRGAFTRNTFLVNGGYNGLDDRYRYYGRAALVLLGRDIDFKAFQREFGLTADGIIGEKSQIVLHQLLYKLPNVAFKESARPPVKPKRKCPLLALFGKN